MNTDCTVGNGRDGQGPETGVEAPSSGKVEVMSKASSRERRNRTLQRVMGRTPSWIAHGDPL